MRGIRHIQYVCVVAVAAVLLGAPVGADQPPLWDAWYGHCGGRACCLNPQDTVVGNCPGGTTWKALSGIGQGSCSYVCTRVVTWGPLWKTGGYCNGTQECEGAAASTPQCGGAQVGSKYWSIGRHTHVRDWFGHNTAACDLKTGGSCSNGNCKVAYTDLGDNPGGDVACMNPSGVIEPGSQSCTAHFQPGSCNCRGQCWRALCAGWDEQHQSCSAASCPTYPSGWCHCEEPQ